MILPGPVLEVVFWLVEGSWYSGGIYKLLNSEDVTDLQVQAHELEIID